MTVAISLDRALQLNRETNLHLKMVAAPFKGSIPGRHTGDIAVCSGSTLCAEQKWRKLRGFDTLAKVIHRRHIQKRNETIKPSQFAA